MPDHFARKKSEPVRLSPANPLHIHIARHTSNILSPMTVSFLAIILIVFYHAQNVPLALFHACIALLFLSIGPTIYIILCVRIGKLTDTDVSMRSQRTGPFLFGIGSAIAGLLALFFTHGPKNLITLLLITILSGILLMGITFWWKISLHASSLAGSLTMLAALYGAIVLPAFLLVALVSWSRVVLRRHTVGQVIAGAGVSILLVVGVVSVRGI